ncbi:MAG: hypothetical protein KDC44_11095 [Phaeodactylibacter sp.]|nr:hypothetical protein [Phaeodactylibacter sp.]
MPQAHTKGQGIFDGTLPFVYRLLGYLFFAAYAALALVYFPERTLFTDAAYQAFYLLQDGLPVISHYRFGNVLPQLLPWAGLLCSADLPVVLALYSLGFPLFFVAIYALLVHWLKNDLLGWTLIAYLCLMTVDSFYYIQSEFYQAVPCILLAVAYLLKHPRLDRWQDWVFLMLLLALIVNYYSLAFLIFLFFWAYGWLRWKGFRHWRYGLLAGLLLVLVVVQGQFFQSSYEAYKMGLFYQALEQYFPRFWEIPSNGKFLWKSWTIYYWWPILLVLLMGLLLRKKYGWISWYVLFSLFGYVILLHYGSPNTTYRFYAELGYLPIIPMIVFPLLVEGHSFLKKPFMPVLFGLILLSRLLIIQGNHQSFTARLDYLRSALDCCTEGKCYQAMQEDPDGLLKMHWAIPYETLLLSSWSGPEHSKTLLLLSSPDKKQALFEQTTIWLLTSDSFEQHRLNPQYFKLPEQPYRRLNCK